MIKSPYVKKLKARYKKYGALSMLHGNCGRQPKRALDIALKQKILEIRKQPEFDTVNVMHFRNILEENYGITVTYSFLYNFLNKNKITHITNMDDANIFLKEYIKKYNKKFKVKPKDNKKAFIPLL